MRTNLYDHYNLQKQELNEVVLKQLEIVNTLEMDKSIKSEDKPTFKLKNLSKRLKDENLNVLVMGLFSSGKSTFINALLGKRILPTSKLPTTAVITIIKHSADEKIILYPKEGAWKGGDSPFSIPINELRKYITIDNESDEIKITPFKKMELFWDLDICKNGIEIVDSPGLDDPDSHDAVTMEYLPSADAIIYCLNSNSPYSKQDHNTIEELRNLGYKSIIFILTNFDRVEESAMFDGDDSAKVFVRSIKKRLSKLTDLGEDGIFFINSLGGVLGKENNDSSILEKSGIIMMEQKLEKFLVNQKGKAKLYKGTQTIKGVNRSAANLIKDRITLSGLSLEELQNQYEKSKIPFERAKKRGRLILERIELGNQDIVNASEDKGRLFIINCSEQVGEWVTDFIPESKISKNPFRIKKSVENICHEYLGQIKIRMEQESAKWSAETLSPMIEDSVKNMFIGLEDSIKSYDKDISDIRLKLSLDKTGEDIAKEQEPSAGSRLTGIAYAILTQDYIGGAMGATFGLKGLLKSLATQLTAGIVLGILSLFTPVGLPAFIIGAIIAAITSAGWNLMSIKGNLKKQVIKETSKALNDSTERNKMIGQINESVSKELAKITEIVEKGISDDIYILQNEMELAIEKQKKGTKEVRKLKGILEDQVIKNEEIKKEVEVFESDLYTV